MEVHFCYMFEVFTLYVTNRTPIDYFDIERPRCGFKIDPGLLFHKPVIVVVGKYIHIVFPHKLVQNKGAVPPATSRYKAVPFARSAILFKETT